MKPVNPSTAAAPTAETSRKPTRERVLLVAGAFLLLLLLSSWATVAICGDDIENDLRSRAHAVLDGLENPRGGDWEIDFKGRDGSVRGEVYDREFRDALVGRLRTLPGVRVVDDKAFDFRHMDDPWLEMAVTPKEKSLTVRGLLPSAGGWKTRVLKMLNAPVDFASSGADGEVDSSVPDLREWRIEDAIEEKGDVFDPGWTAGLVALESILVSNPRAENAAIREGRVTLDGAVYSSESRDAVSIAADAAFRESGLAIDNRFRVVEPPKPPSFSLAWTLERQVRLAGTVADADTKKRMEAMIGDMLSPDDRFASELEVGENTGIAEWEEGVGMLAPGLVNETKVGSLAVEEKKVRITGEMDSEEMRASLQEMATQSFPEDGGYQFDISLTVHIPPRPAIMSVIHMAEAGVKLKGVVGDEVTREAFIALANEKLAKEMPLDTEQIEIERNTMAPAWMPAFAGILPGFVENTTRGGLTVYEDSLVIEAEVPTEAKWDAVWQLSENYFPDPAFTRDVQLKVVDPLLPPEEDLGPEDPDALGMPE